MRNLITDDDDNVFFLVFSLLNAFHVMSRKWTTQMRKTLMDRFAEQYEYGNERETNEDEFLEF